MALQLVFNKKAYAVPKKSIFDLLDHQRVLMDAKTYTVQSSVPVGVFKTFVEGLKTQTKISVTKENAVSLWSLAKEFFLSDLESECAAFPISVDAFMSLSERVSELERQISTYQNMPMLAEAIESQERGLENLRSDADKLQQSLDKLRTETRSAARNTIETLKSQTAPIAQSVSRLELQMSAFSNPLRQFKDERKSQERRLESLRVQVERLKTSLEEFRPFSSAQETTRSRPKPDSVLQSPASTASRPATSQERKAAAKVSSSRQQPAASPPRRLTSRVFHNWEAKSLDGVISHLTKEHPGNIHDLGIVRLTSKSVWNTDRRYALRNVVDLTSQFVFSSKNEPGQWVCWDFREMLIRPTHYTIASWLLKSWVVEGSMDGTVWREIDSKTNTRTFQDLETTTASFVVEKPAEFRFIRLTQTDKDHEGDHYLRLCAVEFFGTLSE
jgi:myosin heavy subunit